MKARIIILRTNEPRWIGTSYFDIDHTKRKKSYLALYKKFTPGESGLTSRGSKGLRSPLEQRRRSLGAH